MCCFIDSSQSSSTPRSRTTSTGLRPLRVPESSCNVRSLLDTLSSVPHTQWTCPRRKVFRNLSLLSFSLVFTIMYYYYYAALCLHNISAICPACVSRSLSTPAADAYDQLHAATSLSQPQKQSSTALVASPSQGQPRGTRCRHHSRWPTVCHCISPSTQDWTFCRSIRLFFSTRFLNCKSGRT